MLLFEYGVCYFIQEHFEILAQQAGEKQLGPERIFNDASLWPQSVIVMTLSQVGNQCGPDFDKLAALSLKYPTKNFIAAGGIRDPKDLKKLSKLGINCALVATALHNGSITTDNYSYLS